MTTDEFWSKVDVREPSECWPWKGSVDTKGYGRSHEDGKSVRASRRALELSGVDVADLLACHTCDNPPCCNPAHLFKGTVIDNNRDAIAKGRHFLPGREYHASFTGEKHPMSKLSDAQREEIRSLSTSGVGYRDLAVRFHISSTTAYYICHPEKQRVKQRRQRIVA